MRKMAVFAALLLCSQMALATNKPTDPEPMKVTVDQTQGQAQGQDQSQGQHQGQSQGQGQNQTANGGTGVGVGIGIGKGGDGGNAKADADSTSVSVSDADATAVSGSVSVSEGGDSASESNSESNANNNGNSQSVNFKDVRQAPSVAQGSVVIPTCGAGGNAGGSNTSGSAFLGLAYIPAKCYDLMYAGAYAAIGQLQAACDILKGGKFGKRAKRNGITLPAVCEAPVAPATPEVDLTGLVTKEEIRERDERILRKLAEK